MSKKSLTLVERATLRLNITEPQKMANFVDKMNKFITKQIAAKNEQLVDAKERLVEAEEALVEYTESIDVSRCKTADSQRDYIEPYITGVQQKIQEIDECQAIIIALEKEIAKWKRVQDQVN